MTYSTAPHSQSDFQTCSDDSLLDTLPFKPVWPVCGGGGRRQDGWCCTRRAKIKIKQNLIITKAEDTKSYGKNRRRQHAQVCMYDFNSSIKQLVTGHSMVIIKEDYRTLLMEAEASGNLRNIGQSMDTRCSI